MFGILRPSSREPTPFDQNAEPPPPRSMAPVPQRLYATRDELMDRVKSWARHQGYAIVISRSRSNRLWLKCDRGGHYENRRNITDEQRKRKRGDSRLMGCPFMVIAVLKEDFWRVKTECDTHNHGPSDDLSAHPSLRKMTQEQTDRLQRMTDAGNTPSEIMDAMREQWPDINVVKRDIYNARKKHKETKKNASTPEEHWEDPNGVMPGPTPTGKWVWAEDGDEIVTKGKKKRRKVFIPTPQPALDPQLQSNAPEPSPQNQHFTNDNLTANMAFPDFTTYPDSSPVNLQPNEFQPTLDHRHHSAPDALQQLTNFTNGQVNNTFANSTLDDFSFPPHPQRNSFPGVPPAHSLQPPQQAPIFHQPRAEPAIMTPTQPAVMTRSAAAAAAAAANQPNNNITNNLSNSHQNRSPSTSTTTMTRQNNNQTGRAVLSRIERIEKEQMENKSMLTQILGAVTRPASADM